MNKPKGFDSGYDKYLEYLESDKWSALRNERLIKDNFRCAICGNPEQLHVHHLFYPADYGEESINDIITLCPICHGLVEKLKKVGGFKAKWQNYDFHMVAIIRAGKQAIRSFLEETGDLYPKGHIFVSYDNPDDSDDYGSLGCTNLYGIRKFQEQFTVDVSVERRY